MRRTLLVAVALAALSAPAMAQGYGPYDPYVTSPRVDQRQSNQAHRIQRGQWDGSISPREADRLWQGQQKIHRMERTSRPTAVCLAASVRSSSVSRIARIAASTASATTTTGVERERTPGAV